MNTSKRRPHRAAKKNTRLGQHFLTSPSALFKIVEAAGVRGDETVIEIGPGKGILTAELLKSAGRVVAVEKDEALFEHLQEIFRKELGEGRLSLVLGDARTYDPVEWGVSGPYVLVANIPYYITGTLFRQSLSSPHPPTRAVLLIQKDVADRIMERDQKSSMLSVSVRAYGTPRFVGAVPPGAFNPPPNVTSAILTIEAISKAFFETIDEEFFFSVLHAGFAHKRKKLFGNLLEHFEKEHVLHAFETLSLDQNVRAEELSTDAWKKLATLLKTR